MYCPLASNQYIPFLLSMTPTIVADALIGGFALDALLAYPMIGRRSPRFGLPGDETGWQCMDEALAARR